MPSPMMTSDDAPPPRRANARPDKRSTAPAEAAATAMTALLSCSPSLADEQDRKTR